MRCVPLAVLVLATSAGGLLAHAVPEQTVNRFAELNPGYRERAGAFYEKRYLPDAVVGFQRAAASRRLSDQDARRLLRGFVYDWLDTYVAGGGSVSVTEHARLLHRLDGQVGGVLCDDDAFARYLDWRRQAQGDANPLAFLMRPPAP